MNGGANLAAFAWFGWQHAMAGEGEDPTNGLAAAAGGMAPLITLFYASVLILITRFGLKALTAIFVPSMPLATMSRRRDCATA